MAISDFLKIFPKPAAPCIYTGQFQTKWKDRPWDESPKKSVHGVSRTKYGDAMQIRLCDNLTLFEMFHKWCDPFAAYICKRNPDWKMVSLRRDTFYNSLIHAFAVKERENGTLYADARGITDDPEEFFLDFNGTDMKVVYEAMPHLLFDAYSDSAMPKQAVADAYAYVYKHQYIPRRTRYE